MTNEALSGEGRAQIDAQTRADGNDPAAGSEPGTTPWPDTPIHGPFVATHRGIFEAYDSVSVWSTQDAAAGFFEQRIADARTWDMSVQEVASSLGDESLTLERPFGPAPDSEESFLTIWRRGRVVGELNTMGGRDLQPEANWRLATLIDHRIQDLLQ